MAGIFCRLMGCKIARTNFRTRRCLPNWIEPWIKHTNSRFNLATPTFSTALNSERKNPPSSLPHYNRNQKQAGWCCRPPTTQVPVRRQAVRAECRLCVRCLSWWHRPSHPAARRWDRRYRPYYDQHSESGEDMADNLVCENG